MQQVSDLFLDIISGDYRVEYKIVINGVTYDESVVRSIATQSALFEQEIPMVGCAVSGQIDVEMNKPIEDIPRMAEMKPYARVANATQESEWV